MGKTAVVGLGALGIVTAGLVVIALTQPHQTTVSAEPRPTFTVATSANPAASTTIDSADMATTMSRLDDKAAAWSMTVLGDSTGNDGNEWVANLGRTIAAEKQRPVTYYPWDLTTSSYGAPVTYGQGTAAPVTIWNGSAAGMGPDYSLANLPTMAAEASDLLIVSHGHNFADPASGADAEAELVNATAEQWQVFPAVAVVLQNPRITNAEAQDANVAAVQEEFSGSPYTVIDATSAFRVQPDLAAVLYPDGVHPNEDGQAIWSSTVTSALGL